MNIIRKNKIIISVVLLLTVITMIVLAVKNKKNTFNPDNFYVQDISAITKIFIADKMNNSVLIEKMPDSAWIINGKYEAQQSVVDMVLGTLTKMRIRYHVSKSAMPNVVKSLSSSAKKVEVYQKIYRINLFDKIKLFPKDKLTKVYYIGHETRDNLGSYVLLKGEKAPYVVYIPGFRGFLEPRFNTLEHTWRTRKIFNTDVHALQSVKVVIPGQNEESYEILKEGNRVKIKLLSSNEFLPDFDTLHTAQFLSSFVNVDLDEYATAIPPLQRDSVFTKNPGFIITLKDTANHTKTVKTYVKLSDDFEDDDFFKNLPDPDRMYAIIDDKDTVFIQYFIFDNILHPASYFMRKN